MHAKPRLTLVPDDATNWPDACSSTDDVQTATATNQILTNVDSSSDVDDLLARIRELELENALLREISHEDELTELANRRHFEKRLREAFLLRRRQRDALSVLLIDLDDFKRLNDTVGHAAGDVALRTVGWALRCSIRGSDIAARLGGDEFAILLPATDKKGAEMVASRVRANIRMLSLDGQPQLGASVGVATIAGDDPIPSADALLEAADAAMYADKRARKTTRIHQTNRADGFVASRAGLSNR